MGIIKRVTVTIELVDPLTKETSWTVQETVERSTGDNPRFHVADAEVASKAALRNTLDLVAHRFGSPPIP